jgi:EpsG-like putative glucosyltransferase
MWPYWLIFMLPCIAVLITKPGAQPSRPAWFLVASICCIFIGFRHEVGADWFNYIYNMHRVSNVTLLQALSYNDPGYYGLNWLVAQMGGTLHWVNFVCAVIVVFGACSFSMKQPLPWLAFLVAVPYLLIVVAMGYTRQGAAIGFALAGLAALGQHKTRQFVIWVILGALFHKSAVVLLPIAALSATRNRIWTFFWVAVTSLVAAYVFVYESSDYLISTYLVSERYQSEGARIRVLMNVIPSILILIYRRKLFYSLSEQKLWVWLSIFSLLTIPLLPLSSTAVDRLALYFIPIQLIVYSRLPFMMKMPSQQHSIAVGVAGCYGAVLFVWLTFAGNAWTWLPYRNFLFL